MSSEARALSADARRSLSRLASLIILLAAGLGFAILILALSRWHADLGFDQILTFYVAPAVFVLALLGT